jgi:hypothetical protein
MARSGNIRIVSTPSPDIYYRAINVAVLQHDPVLSWKAKGLLCYLLSLPDDWKLSITDLVKRSKDGADGVYTGLKELVDRGYLIRRQQIDSERGQFGSMTYEVCSGPHPDLPLLDFPHAVNPKTLVVNKKSIRYPGGGNVDDFGESKKEDSPSTQQDAFDQFWKAYPPRNTPSGQLTKGSKGAALKAWRAAHTTARRRIAPVPPIDELLAILRILAQTDPEYIPLPTTFLNQNRWIDYGEEENARERSPRILHKTLKELTDPEVLAIEDALDGDRIEDGGRDQLIWDYAHWLRENGHSSVKLSKRLHPHGAGNTLWKAFLKDTGIKPWE